MWVYVENGDLTKLKCKPKGGCWHKLIRLAIKHVNWVPNNCGGIDGEIGSLDGIKWKYFANVEVLHLYGVHLEQTLNLEGLACLRVLEVWDIRGIDGIKGLGKLKNLTHFRLFLFNSSSGVPIRIVGQLPMSLKVLKIRGLVVLVSDALAQCHCLVNLSLDAVKAISLDLSNCGFLESVDLVGIEKLQTLLGLATYQSSRLQYLIVLDCKDLVDIPGIDHLINLKELYFNINLKFEVPSLLALTELQVLNLYHLERFVVVCSKDIIPCQLQELGWSLSQSSKGLNLNGFSKLEGLNLSDSNGLTSLAELGDLPTLRVLDLRRCKYLLQLPDLSKSRNLEELHLAGCYALELHERDIQMLFELPLLQPLPFEDMLLDKGQSFRLDLRRGKVLVHQSIKAWNSSLGELWRAGEWEELDLGPPPIRIGELGPFEIGTDSDSIEYVTESKSDSMEFGVVEEGAIDSEEDVV